MIKQFLIICSLLLVSQGYSQWDFSGELTGRGWFSTDEKAPFWNHTNRNGRYDAASDYYGSLSGSARYRFNEKQQLEFGGNIGYSNGLDILKYLKQFLVSGNRGK